MAVERAGPPPVRMAPHIAQKLFAREYAHRLAGERAQQLVLLGCQLDSVLPDLYDPCREVDRQLADAQHPRGAPCSGAAKQRGDPGAKLGVGVRLTQEFTS